MFENLMKTDSDKMFELVTTYGTKVIGFLVLVAVTWIVAGWAKRLSLRSFKKAKLDLALANFFSTLLRYTVLVVGGISCLGIFGIQTASFAAVLAAAGFAVGMALQGTLGNFASGVMLLFFRPFDIGDVITVSGTTGKVVLIELFSTVLDTPDNRRIIIPNSSVYGASIENVTFHNTRRVDVAVGTDYTADLDKAREIMLAAAKGVNGVLTDPAPAVVLTGLGASSIDWSIRVWCKTEDYWAVMDALTRSAKYALDKAEIGIPFPQVDVHFDGELAQVMNGVTKSASTQATVQ